MLPAPSPRPGFLPLLLRPCNPASLCNGPFKDVEVTVDSQAGAANAFVLMQVVDLRASAARLLLMAQHGLQPQQKQPRGNAMACGSGGAATRLMFAGKLGMPDSQHCS